MEGGEEALFDVSGEFGAIAECSSDRVGTLEAVVSLLGVALLVMEVP
jgi:hypothetical protein